MVSEAYVHGVRTRSIDGLVEAMFGRRSPTCCIMGRWSCHNYAVSDAPLPEAALAIVRKPNPAVMATVTSDGRPVSVATWYLLEDDGLLMLCMNSDRARLKHLKNNGHVSLTVLAADDFGTHVSVQGHVVSIKPDEGLADIDRLSRHFLGKDYPARESPLVTVHVAIDRWFGWSGGRPLEY